MLNKLNEKIRIFSHPLNFSQFYLIYFYTHGISSRGFNQSLVLRNLQLNETCNPLQICSWIFSKYFQNNFLLDNSSRPLSYISFHILRNSHLQKKLFLKISQSSQKSTCVGASFLINLQASVLQLH